MRQKNPWTPRYTLAALLLLVSGCSWLEPINPFSSAEPAPAADAQASETAPAATDEPANAERSVIEVLWRVPGEGVDAYLLDYGFEETNLDRQVRIPVIELSKIDHPKHGPVFRYELKGVPAERTIYMSLRAENKHGVSEGSRIVKVEPGQQSVVP